MPVKANVLPSSVFCDPVAKNSLRRSKIACLPVKFLLDLGRCLNEVAEGWSLVTSTAPPEHIAKPIATKILVQMKAMIVSYVQISAKTRFVLEEATVLLRELQSKATTALIDLFVEGSCK